MITDNYIKMCEQAEEIQKAWKPEEYDIFTYDGTSLFRYPLVKRTKEWMIKHSPIWLPTQEQLQETLWQGLDMYEHWISKLLDFILDLPFEPFSMNEVWLMFVMKEKYNKIWTGEKWEKIN